ncbi:type II secretion system minor pseudopilin GspK [Caenimonas soli]|uniref:type II secretion system minor pseudopilin GspK n=1 Tax=Caenimonas soli TaxID=2735555 RepID=UPI001553A82B|nr:type II secretion system minor pseudopilin GspK [Caenimonas soli]NPC57976.1 type II secretion system minor pseudopilin GspK [Caenimonas soli]
MKKRSRGAALLTAMLTVALVATFAAAALWQQWRSIEVETAERARVQSAWILTGALDWARLILREDRNGIDHLGEPWAVPLQEARLSSFLAADRNTTTESGPEVLEAFLSGQVIDLQSLLNVNNLLEADGKLSKEGLESFERLFEVLGLPQAELERMAENLRFASDTSAGNRSSPMAPLRPQRVAQLVWLGLSAQTVATLQPYITILPGRTPVNLNTASAEVIYASAHQLSMADAQVLVAERERAPFKTNSDAYKLLPGGAPVLAQGQFDVGVASRFFEIRARLRLDELVVEERSVLQRSAPGGKVTVLDRERGIVDPTTLSQAAAKR